VEKSRKKQSKKARNTRSSTILFDNVTRLLRMLDRNRFVFVLSLILFLSLGTHIKLNFEKDWPAHFQIQHLNPDAKLYYALAQNIVDGTGYFDTLRNDQIIPPIGHPLLLALLCIKMGLSPAAFSWLLLSASFVLLALAVRIYTTSNILVIIFLWLYGSFFAYIRWLSANIEASIVVTNALLVLSLALLYKTSFKTIWAVIAGIVLAMHLLIRPLYLFPTHVCFILFGGIALYNRLRKRSLLPVVKAWLILLAVAECLLLATYAYSYLRYKDSRLVTGTYGAYALYAANNIYEPPVGPFLTNVKHSDEFYKIYSISVNNPAITWQQRHKIMTNEVISYWKKHPLRALTGWWWRFRQFMGIYSGSFSWKQPLTIFHAFSVSFLFILLAIKIIAFKYKGQKSQTIFSLGVICAALFLLYSAIHAVFVYAEFRYVTVTISLLTAANVFLLFEIGQAFKKTPMLFLQGSKSKLN
jgi:hypothetical protein